jgi:type III restriction enzyme
VPTLSVKLEGEQREIDKIVDIKLKQTAQNNLDAKRAIINVLPDFNSIPGVRTVDDLRGPEVKRKVIELISDNLSKGQGNLFASQILAEAEVVYDTMVSEFKNNIIEIPRIDLVQADVEAYFENFDLDTSELTYQALDQEIIRMGLRDNLVETLSARSSGYYGNPVKLIIAEVINYPEIDYDENADLLYKLADQACSALKDNLPDPDQLNQVVFQFKAAIADKIYRQMKSNFKLTEPDYLEQRVFPFERIEQWNFSALANAGYKDYRDIVQPTNSIPKFVFRGFEKACHFEYKFDSKTEQDLAFILENDKMVLKWLRPSPNQFRIYWDNNSKRYEPDFVVETKDSIYMIECKMSSQVDALDVQAKRKAAETYCKYATEFTSKNGGKSWKYVIIPHNFISRTMSLTYLITQFH